MGVDFPACSAAKKGTNSVLLGSCKVMTLNWRLVLDGHNALISLELSLISDAVNGPRGCWVVILPPMYGREMGISWVDIVFDGDGENIWERIEVNLSYYMNQLEDMLNSVHWCMTRSKLRAYRYCPALYSDVHTQKSNAGKDEIQCSPDSITNQNCIGCWLDLSTRSCHSPVRKGCTAPSICLEYLRIPCHKFIRRVGLS